MATSNVLVLRTGTGWTVDVTACNLSSDTTLKDFVVLEGGSLGNNANYAKTTATVLTYSGPSLGANTQVEVRRSTPAAPIQTFQFGARFSSGDLNAEIDRISRRAEEYALNGIGPGSVISVQTPQDDAFGPAWNGNTVNPPTKNAVYDYVVTLAPIDSPAFTGNPTAPTPLISDNDTSVATTGFVQSLLGTYAPLASPTFTGNPNAPTQSVGDNDTSIATTQFVQTALSSSPVLGGNPTAPTAGRTDNDTSVATTAHVKDTMVVKQVQQNTVTSTVTANSTTWVTVTTLSFTPKDSASQVLVQYTGTQGLSDATAICRYRFSVNGVTSTEFGGAVGQSLTELPYLDVASQAIFSPAAAGPYTVAVQVQRTSGSGNVQVNPAAGQRAVMTVTEIRNY